MEDAQKVSDMIAFLLARLNDDGRPVVTARMRREIAAKQAIIKLREQAYSPQFDDDPWNRGYEAAMRDVLGQLAAIIWGDHAGYRQEWKP